MVKKSIDCCGMPGVDVSSALVEKLSHPHEVELRIGNLILHKIRGVTHNQDDGWPIVEAEGNQGELITFQFLPDDTPFSLSAVNADGQRLCPDQTPTD
jgi:hypothetical protein